MKGKWEDKRKCSHNPCLVYSFVVTCCLLCPLTAAQAQAWREIKSEHFVVYFTVQESIKLSWTTRKFFPGSKEDMSTAVKNGGTNFLADDEGFAREVSRASESYYTEIASELGYQRYSGFWTWDNRVKIYLHPDRESFLQTTGQPRWSQGVANYTDKEISSYAGSGDFLNALLPHEMTHLIFRDYVGFKGEVPLWLDEGVAQWMEPRKREAVKSVIARLAEQGKLISLRRMMTLDIRKSNDNDLVNVYYIQAVSLVSFLVTKYSAARFTNFCRQLRDGKSIEASLTFAYPTSIRNIEELEEEWEKHIREERHE